MSDSVLARDEGAEGDRHANVGGVDQPAGGRFEASERKRQIFLPSGAKRTTAHQK